MLHGLVVQLGGDDDVLVADVAWHDILVELHHHVVAVTQDAVAWRRRGELVRSHVILHYGYLLAIDGHRFFTVHRRGVGTEGVGALWVVVGIAHVVRQV